MSFVKVGDSQPINVITAEDVDRQSTADKMKLAKERVKNSSDVEKSDDGMKETQ